jgi:DNA-binding NarL/FixJ family response regulator
VLSAQASSFVCPPSLQTMLHAVVDKIEAYDTLGAEINELIAPQVGPRQRLTFREGDVLRLIGQGLSNNQIAEVLQLSVHTVETHRRNLSGKLGFKGAELVRYATLQSLQTG